MLESLILTEYEEKDYGIFDQQILDRGLSPKEFEETLARIVQTKTASLQKKIKSLLDEGRQDLIELAFKRAQKRHKTHMTLRFMMSEHEDMGE